jgi:hypothetical protein
MKVTHSHGKADYIGILGSALCIVHCLLVPALAFGTTTIAHDHHAHTGLLSLDYFFIVINGAAVYFATKEHKSLPLRILLWSALSIFAVSLLLENVNPIFTVLGYIGSGLLIAGHLTNLYICQIAPRLKYRAS